MIRLSLMTCTTADFIGFWSCLV